MMAAAYTTYLGKAAEDVRSSAVKIWRNLTGTKKFDYSNLLSSESELLSFKKDGLPADTLSMENAVIILNGDRRFPFIIDPSGEEAYPDACVCACVCVCVCARARACDGAWAGGGGDQE